MEKTIYQTADKKYVLAQDSKHYEEQLKTELEWNWHDVSKNLAKKNILNILHKIDSSKFEYFVRDVVKKAFPDVSFEVTVSTGDMGIDIFGTRKDPTHRDRKEAICIQVKNFKGTVGRPEADKFVGAVQSIINDKNNNFSKFEGLFITSGKFPKSFNEKLCSSSKTGVTFACWDGDELTEKILALGLGVKYSIDIDFWKDIDSKLLNKINS